jgi:hypothetical protein
MTTTTALSLSPAALLTEQGQLLHRHVQQCQAARGRWFQAAAWAELAHGLVAPRFVTTVSVAALLLLATTW